MTVGILNRNVGNALASPRYVPLTVLQRLFLWLYIFSFCFDFKGPFGGSIAQTVFLGVLSFAIVGFFLVTKIRPSSPGLRWITSYWWLYIAITFITILAGTITDTLGVYPIIYLKVVFPYLLCGVSLIICQQLEARNADPKEIITPLIICGIVSGAWHFYYALHGANDIGAEISDVRYQILGPLIGTLFAYGLVGVFSTARVSPVAVVALIASIGPALLSVTRGFIITGVLCSVALIVCLLRDPTISHKVALRLIGRFFLFVAVAVVIFAGAIVVRPNTLESWNERMFSNSGGQPTEDPTYLIRMAEASWDWKAINESPQFLLTGKGIGAAYGHDHSYAHLMSGIDMDENPEVVPADCTWTYAMFSSGLIFGAMMLGIFVLPMLQTLRVVWDRKADYDPTLRLIKLFVFLSLTAEISLIFSSAPLADRMGALSFGFIVGLAYWKDIKKSDVRSNS